MKKLIICLMSILMTLAFLPAPAAIPTAAKSEATSVKAKDAAAAHDLLARLDEIKAMDKSHISSTDKKELKKEVRSIRHQLKEISGGIYLSFGAIIIIILLLILL